MSIAAVQELIAKQALDKELLSQFIDFTAGEVVLRFESEYWDYKRSLPHLDDPRDIAELAADVLAFHNSRGGYLIYGITDDFAILGLHEQEGSDIDSNKINHKLRKFIGDAYPCRYSCLPLSIGGSKKCLAVLFIPRRKGVAIKTQAKSTCFKEGELFLRSNDTRKRTQTDAEFLELYSPPEPEVIVGSHQLRTYSPRPGIRLFLGDYASTGFIGDITRQPIVNRTLEELSLGKWDIVLLKGVGGVGKTAVATEITSRIANDGEWRELFNGVISLSGKSEQLTPFDRSAIAPEITSYESFLRQIIFNSGYDADIPHGLDDLERVAVKEIVAKKILLFIDNYETIETRESRVSTFLCNLPPGCKTLITSRHIPTNLPALPIEVPPLDRTEAEMLARAESAAQHLEAVVNKNIGQILDSSGYVPLAIKWIISCSKNADHLAQLIDDHRKGKPKLANLCEFCFTFEYNLLSEAARKKLALLPIFRVAPTQRELAFVAESDTETMATSLEELVNFSLVIREYSPQRGENIYRLLKLTEGFAEAKLRGFGDLERLGRRRLKELYGASIADLLASAEDMLSRSVSPGATRKYIEEEILDREPDSAEGMLLRAITFEREGSYSSAIKNYQKAINLCNKVPEVGARAALRLVQLRAYDPQLTREDLVQVLERVYNLSGHPQLGVEVAKNLEILGQHSKALGFYERVFQSDPVKAGEAWEQAFAAICISIERSKGDKLALDFTRDALKSMPASKVVLNHERKYMKQLGLLRYKTTRPN